MNAGSGRTEGGRPSGDRVVLPPRHAIHHDEVLLALILGERTPDRIRHVFAVGAEPQGSHADPPILRASHVIDHHTLGDSKVRVDLIGQALPVGAKDRGTNDFVTTRTRNSVHDQDPARVGPGRILHARRVWTERQGIDLRILRPGDPTDHDELPSPAVHDPRGGSFLC